MNITLHSFQEESADQLRENMRREVKSQILVAPTGSGKTVIAASLLAACKRRNKRAIFVCDRIALIDQTSATLDQYGIDHGVIQADHWRRRSWENVQVASAQTLGRRNQWPSADLIIVDEAHTLPKAVAKHIASCDAFVIGLSATPFTKGLANHFKAVVTVTTTNALIKAGYLAPFRVFAASEPDMKGAATRAGEWTTDEASARSMPIVGDCVTEYLKHADGKKFIAFAVDVAHAAELQRQFMASGIHVATYTYKTTTDERDLILDEFRKPDSFIRGLISVSALAKGFDVSDIEVVIMARPLRSSFTEHIQILGRGLRAHPGKKECLILDHAGNMLRFWDRMTDFFENGTAELDDGKRKTKEKKKHKEREPMKCSKCFHVHDPRPACPACGHEYPRKKNEISHLAGQLMELTGSTTAGTERQALYSQLLHIAREHGYKEGWANHMYKEKTGVWPDGLRMTIEKPSAKLRSWYLSWRIRRSNTRKNAA